MAVALAVGALLGAVDRVLAAAAVGTVVAVAAAAERAAAVGGTEVGTAVAGRAVAGGRVGGGAGGEVGATTWDFGAAGTAVG